MERLIPMGELKEKAIFSLREIDENTALKSWWTAFFVIPVSRRLVWVFVNKTKITPNTITCLSIIFRMLGILSFVFANGRINFIFGAFFIYIAYVIDYSDGAVARLKDSTSEFGRYLDHVSDLIGDICILCALAFSQNMLFSVICLSMIFMHIAECYCSYLTGLCLLCPDINDKNNTFLTRLNKYRKWWF